MLEECIEAKPVKKEGDNEGSWRARRRRMDGRKETG
jgi:hypothetical protein